MSRIPPGLTRVDLPNGNVIEEAEYDVVLTFRLRTRVVFSEMERASRITVHDAIANAYGSMPADALEQLLDGFGGEFTVVAEITAKEV